jgi:hypothetical protein
MIRSSYKQTFIGIWFHDKNLSSDQQDKMQRVLNQIFYYYRIFVDEDFYSYIDEERLVAKIFLIISTSDSSLDSIVEIAEQYPQTFEKIYNFSSTRSRRLACFNANNIDDLTKQMKKDLQDFDDEIESLNRVNNEMRKEAKVLDNSFTNRPSPSFSVFNSKIKKNTPIRHVAKESLNFCCFLTMTNILRRISSYSSEELSEMWSACRKIYGNNHPQLDHIDKLENEYAAHKVIEYYTGNSCLSRTVNQACHTEDMQRIFTFRVFISDLHKKLDELDKQQHQDGTKSCIQKIYRGKPQSGSVLQQLIDNQGGLISMNGFLSTTKHEEVAPSFHGDHQVSRVRQGYRPVLFVLEINTNIKQPYASIVDCSTKPYEAEVLFSLGTIWRIKSVKFKEDPCIIELISCDELDSQSAELLRKYTENGCNLSSVGDILYELGNDEEAEWFYNKELKQGSRDNITPTYLYYKIGKIRFEKGDYSVALDNYKKAENLLRTSSNESDSIKAPQRLYVWDNQSPLIAIHNTMGIIYEKDNEFEKAIDCYKQALDVKNGSPSEIAIVHDNLGLLLYYYGRYEEAREHHRKAVENSDEMHPKRVEFTRNLQRAEERLGYRRDKLPKCQK